MHLGNVRSGTGSRGGGHTGRGRGGRGGRGGGEQGGGQGPQTRKFDAV
jgi:hypothetical protein